MILSDTAIRRPVFVSMIIAAIVVFGLISFKEIGIDLFPRVEFPTITILSVLPGADPETVETTVTDLIEEAVSTISDIKHLRSTSAENVSQVIVEFELEKDVDVAYQEIQAKIGTIRSDLPDDLEEPVVEKFDVDAAPIMAIVLSGNQPIHELTEIADKIVKERVQRIQNVGQVKIVGGRDRKMWIWLDRNRLEGYGLAVQDVIQALQSEHVEIPGGRVETGPKEYVVKTKAEFYTADEFSNLLVAYRNNAPVRIRDLGRAEEGLEEERTLARLDEARAVALLVRRQSGTNTVEVAENVKREVDRLRSELAPRGVRLEIAKDQSIFIEHSVDEVYFHLLFGGGLAILIVFFFLRNARSTFISSLVLPTAVIGTFMFMNVLDFTQNMMTLLGLSLAIGLLIDDAIVVQENIMRHIEEGKPSKQAAQEATSEIGLAVLAVTLSVVAVFVPVAFMEGIVGRFFYQFGLTVAFAVLISMFVSFTLDPMLSSRILKKPEETEFLAKTEKIFVAIEERYERILHWSLKKRGLVVGAAVASFILSGFLAGFLRGEFMPLEDQSEFIIKVSAPLGASLRRTDDIFSDVRAALKGIPWTEYLFETVGADELGRVNEGELYVKMVPKDERDISQEEAMRLVRERLKAIAQRHGAKISVQIVPRVAGGGRKWADIQLEIRGSDLNRLEALTTSVMDFMRKTPGYADIDTTFERNKPQVGVYVKRDRAADMGVSSGAIGSTVRALIGGEDVTKYRVAGDRYDVAVRLREDFRNTTASIEQLSVRSSSGALIRLPNVARADTEVGPVQIDRYNRARQITVLANLERDKKVLGEAVAELTEFLESTGLPPGYSFGFAGTAQNMQESFSSMLFALFLAVIIIYMVLASQFESFVHPFTIMLALPLSIVGAFGALVATGLTLNLYTMIGMILLMGLVTKNGVLLVDYTNVLRERDLLARDTAVLRAGPVRLRPILMTTLALIFGMLPLALGTGAGAESRQPMAVAVIGGLLTSTLLTLIVVPVVYTLIDDTREWVMARFRRVFGATETASSTGDSDRTLR